jgi:hypothetical protein
MKVVDAFEELRIIYKKDRKEPIPKKCVYGDLYDADN